MKRTLLRSTLLSATSLALLLSGASAQHVFWSELDRGEVWTAEADGSNPRAIVSGLGKPIGIGLDTANGHMYIAEDGTGQIVRAPIGGGATTTLVTGRTNPQMLSLDLVGGHIYWSEYSGQVMRSDLSGNNVQTILDSATRYTALALDRGNEQLYASDPALGDQLWISNFDGSGATQSPESPFGNWTTNDMVIVGDQMYYPHSSDIRVSPLNDLSAGAATTLGTHSRYGLGIAAGPDGTIYWTARNTGDLMDGAIGVYDGSFNENFIAAENPFGIAVVPEPSTYAAIFGGAGLLLVFLRRRFRK